MYAYPQPYAMLNGPQYYEPPPRRKKPKGCGPACCRCICCFCCFILIIFMIQSLAVLYFYLSYDPKSPSYRIENIDVKSFDLKPDSTLTTNIHLVIRAENPNTHMEFVYADGSDIIVLYNSTLRICDGRLPSFRQPHENVTIIQTELTGVSTLGQAIMDDFMERQKNHTIPLLVTMKVPINVILGDTTLRELTVFLKYALVVDGLKPGNETKIVSKEMSFYVEVGRGS